ncbi:MAG: hypothetical protein ACP5UB_05175 [Candidatus Sumerlaeaceae bacterium]
MADAPQFSPAAGGDHSRAAPESFTATFVLGLIVGLTAAALYLPTLRYGFVWDDVYFVVKNTTIRTWSTWRDDFTTSTAYAAMVNAAMFRPARNWSYRLDWMLAGLNPVWWHAHNVLLHAVNSMLVFTWLLSLLKWLHLQQADSGNDYRRPLAFIAALVWAVHPVHTEAVCWIKDRDELLFTFFSLLGLLLTVAEARRKAPRMWARVGILLFTSLALLSKEMAASLPLLVGLLAIFAPRGCTKRPYFGGIMTFQIAVVVAYMFLRHRALGGTAQCGYLSGAFLTEMFTMVRAAAHYVVLTLWPARLVADYSHFESTRTLFELRWWLALGVVLATFLFALIARRRAPLCTFGILWFWLALLPVSNVIPTMQFLAERFLYFPLIGAALALAGVCRAALAHRHTVGTEVLAWRRAFAGRIALRTPRHTQLALVMALIITALVARSVLRIGVWREEVTLYAATLRDAPRNGRAFINVVITLANRGDAVTASNMITRFYASTDPVLRSVNPQMLLRAEAAVATRLGEFAKAAELWRRALQTAPADVDALFALGICEGNLGNHESALRCFIEAARQDPYLPNLRRNMFLALQNLGRHAEANALARGALSISDLATTSSAPMPTRPLSTSRGAKQDAK